MSWSDKVALVTRAPSGIGEATACKLAQRGVRVALVARSAEKLAALECELGAERGASFPLDVTARASLSAPRRAWVERFGRLDFLVNRAKAVRSTFSPGLGLGSRLSAIEPSALSKKTASGTRAWKCVFASSPGAETLSEADGRLPCARWTRPARRPTRPR